MTTEYKILIERFVRQLVIKEKQERFLYELNSKKRGIDRLNHELFTIININKVMFKGTVEESIKVLVSSRSSISNDTFYIDNFHKEGCLINFNDFISYFKENELALIGFIDNNTVIIKEENHPGICSYIFELE